MRLSRCCCCCCCCHLPLGATCISLAPLAAAFAFTRLACSYQCNLWLQTADLQLLLLVLAACCNRLPEPRATRQRRQRCSDATCSACSYFRLPHFVANSSSSSSVRHPKTGVAFGLCNTHVATSDPNFVARTQQQLQGQHAKQSWVCSAG